MLSVNRINGTENLYSNQNKKISFKSKFVPNEALKDAFYIAKVNTQYAIESWRVENSRYFARIVDYGKDDLIKVTRSPKGSTTIINKKRVNFYKEEPPTYLIDGERVINNVVDYFTRKEFVEVDKLSSEELKSIKPAIDILNSDLNADDAIKNPYIRYNLMNNIDNVNRALRNNTLKLLENLESKIFNK